MTTSWQIRTGDPNNETDGESDSRVAAATAIGNWLRESIAKGHPEDRTRYTITIDGNSTAILQLGHDSEGIVDIGNALRQIDHIELSIAS